jgi:hypothetical protein
MKSNALKHDVFKPETAVSTLDRPDPSGTAAYVTGVAQAALRSADELILPDLIERITSGAPIAGADGLTNERARDAVFNGEPLEASTTNGGTWAPIFDYMALIHFMVIETPNAKWIIQRLLLGEIVRVGEVFIRKTPEARRGLSQSRL